jgi:hypothetical protein
MDRVPTLTAAAARAAIQRCKRSETFLMLSIFVHRAEDSPMPGLYAQYMQAHAPDNARPDQ